MLTSAVPVHPSSKKEVKRSTVPTRSLQSFFIAVTLVSVFILSAFYISTCPEDGYITINSIALAFRGLKAAAFYKLQSKPLSPLILLGTPFFGHDNWLPSPEKYGHYCPYLCEITSNRSRLNDSIAVVFHLRDTNIQDLPQWKGKRQFWVLHNIEAPPNTPAHILEVFQGRIDWTMSYRRDSDIFAGYGRIVKRTKRKKILSNNHPNKSLACWIVSNCNTASKREHYVNELRQFIPVHIYGKCGELSCPGRPAKLCYNFISKNCKFYLSFENSLCRDYITEKVFHALDSDMVPVVMGGADYSKFLPNHSYIDVFDYSSPRKLALHLMELDEDLRKYGEYHLWKQHYEVVNDDQFWACRLCKKVHESLDGSPKQTTSRRNLVEWWYRNGSCLPWKRLHRLRKVQEILQP